MATKQFSGSSFIGAAMAALTSAATPSAPVAGAAAAGRAGELDPHSGPVTRVGFLLGEDANVMDVAGAWEVFHDTRVGPRKLFQIFTVAPTRELLTMSGGLRVAPHYHVDDAPQPDVIVVPAHLSTEASQAWLQNASSAARVTMSVCTGAFHLAAARLLDGYAATTHHLFFDAFEKAYPHVDLRRTERFVDNGRIVTAGGLTAGIDAALHIVNRLYGTEVAERTANYLEYHGRGWQECRP